MLRYLVPDTLLATAPALRAVEWIANSSLDVGTVRLSGVMPNGSSYRVLPRHIWLMADARRQIGATAGPLERTAD